MAWSSYRMHDFSTTGTVLRKDRGSRLKGVNSLKLSGDLWGPNLRSNRATYPYSEPLSNMCFLKSVVGRDPQVPEASMICNVHARNKVSPVESPSCAHLNVVSSGHACARLNATRLGSVHLPGDTREKESPLPVYDPKVEGR
ncbi:hypothetical protein CRG98_022015 [Punica granatum]|uniref:Uncharacterized protein n=1 Tax=Punica granatum TaxID=22663 RepID=A0A2I0JMN2_PUNGR|nr:hypothetical protein CRG98_022015 [Punica granatum]